MRRKNMDISDKILFSIGMYLFVVLFFILAVGVIFALLASWGGGKQEEIGDTVPIQNKETRNNDMRIDS
ncbi:hypothetical protein D8M04_18860 [Oceanobacillus piezotolerans]|uniref:Uncharacterized protein n=1 Tax=Oceanobacillus piezotolerans TaxID=2448030 RepID=A0A498D6C4_9BACI|nr:hypothetical protein [Oceanobacillus piezotolerans]RLL40607.1 hypothetical protein D8M04_18860 [Oceanobacillus piezotolerans]